MKSSPEKEIQARSQERASGVIWQYVSVGADFGPLGSLKATLLLKPRAVRLVPAVSLTRSFDGPAHHAISGEVSTCIWWRTASASGPCWPSSCMHFGLWRRAPGLRKSSRRAGGFTHLRLEAEGGRHDTKVLDSGE